jgi:hypothetical protein
MAESFMRTLKHEEVDGTASRAAAKTRRLIGRFIKVVCAARPFLEFFAATIRNTRQAYLTAVGRFFAWCGRNQLGQIADIEPLRVVAYIEALGEDFAKPTIVVAAICGSFLLPALCGQATQPRHSPCPAVSGGENPRVDGGERRLMAWPPGRRPVLRRCGNAVGDDQLVFERG